MLNQLLVIQSVACSHTVFKLQCLLTSFFSHFTCRFICWLLFLMESSGIVFVMSHCFRYLYLLTKNQLPAPILDKKILITDTQLINCNYTCHRIYLPFQMGTLYSNTYLFEFDDNYFMIFRLFCCPMFPVILSLVTKGSGIFPD